MKINYWQSFEAECFYHIYNRSVGEELIFREENDYSDFLLKYKKYLLPNFELYAYCLMPNHFHFIVKVRAEKEILAHSDNENTSIATKYKEDNATLNQFIGDQLRRMFSSISIKYNNKHNRRGPLFSPRAKRIFISNDDRVRYLINYVHHNPIHHKFTQDYSHWKWSSYNAINSYKETLVIRDAVLDLYGGKEGFNDFHNEFRIMKMDDEID